MAKASAVKKTSGEAPRRPKGKPVAKSTSGSKAEKPASGTKKSKARPVERALKGRTGKARTGQKAPAGKQVVAVPPPPHSEPAKPSRLIRDTKNTPAALSLLEKGIKLIYQKEFRKARVELESLISRYASEAEIAARARSYVQICQREEEARHRRAPSNDELYSLGVIEHNRGQYDAAVAYFRQSLEKRPNADYVYYSLAASLALKGEVAPALENLKTAIELNEENRIYAKNDADFLSLHGTQGLAAILGMNPASGREPSK